MRWLCMIVCLTACNLSWGVRDYTRTADAAHADAELGIVDAATDAATDAAVGLSDSAVDTAVSADALVLGSMVQRAYVKSATTGQSKMFGSGIALSADGSRLAISEANSVQIFTRSGSMWSYEATIAVGVDTVAAGGNVLALSGDGARIAVGVQDVAAFVFVRAGTTWTQEARLDHPAKQTADFFGCSVAMSRDGMTVVVGAYDENSTNVSGTLQTFAGAAHVFTRSVATWTYRQRVLGSNTEPNDYFGSAVSVSGDGSFIAVGAWGESSSSTGIDGNQGNSALHSPGAAYLFVRSGTTWVQQAYVKASDTATDQYFGWSVSLDDAGSTFAVGAYYWGSGIGAAYVFTRSGSVWSQQARIQAPNAETNDLFGISVALAADGNTLAVGAGGEAGAGTGPADNSKPYSGAAYVFTRAVSMWSCAAYVKASNPDADDRFGRVALSGTGTVLAVGAYAEASGATGIGGDQTSNAVPYAGAAYVFE